MMPKGHNLRTREMSQRHPLLGNIKQQSPTTMYVHNSSGTQGKCFIISLQQRDIEKGTSQEKSKQDLEVRDDGMRSCYKITGLIFC
jgi:phenylacetate-coenzyme A ligase PaaK-like adenylate-forming protein